MTTLVILESPGKVKKMMQILGHGYRVVASVGHICDLSSNALSVDIDPSVPSFTPQYKTLPGRRAVIQRLRDEATKSHGNVIIATDLDREGEFIAHSVRQVLGLQNPPRLRFTSITRSAIQAAMADPGTIDERLVEAQKARRVMDRLVGYLVSPLLGSGNSAGRVQSVVVKMILERQREVERFLDEEIPVRLEVRGWFEGGLEGVLQDDIQDEGEALRLILGDDGPFLVEEESVSEEQRNPPPPYTTSTLQQDAWVRLRMTAAKAMAAAQKLYESGLITYHRTDSNRISPEGVGIMKDFIVTNYGSEFSTPRMWGGAAGAHEAIRVTDPTTLVRGDKLYQMIWTRSLQSQMSASVHDVQRILLARGVHRFLCAARRLRFEGYLVLGSSAGSTELHDVSRGDLVPIVRCECRQVIGPSIPTRFQESTLIDRMEHLGIGRPSTYANTLKVIADRGYVRVADFPGVAVRLRRTASSREAYPSLTLSEEKIVDAGAEKKRYEVTEKGKEVTAFLEERFPQIMDYGFTASMEDMLDSVAAGTVGWQEAIARLYFPLDKSLGDPPRGGGGHVLGEDGLLRYTFLPKAKHGACIRIDHTRDGATFFAPAPPGEVTLETAREWAADRVRYLGMYRSNPVLVVRGPHDFYLRHGRKTVGVKKHGDITFEMAKKVLGLRRG